MLTANNLPLIGTDPTNQTVTAGQTATFTAAASGTPAPTMQWQLSTDDGATWNLVGGIAPWTPIDAITGYQLGPFGTYFPLDPNAFTSLRITTDAGRTFKTYSFAIQ